MTPARTAVAAAVAAALAASPAASAAKPLFTGDGTPLTAPHLAAGGGAEVAAWSEHDPGAAWAATRRAGTWSPAVELPVRGRAVVADVAVDGRGTALVAVIERIGGSRPGLRVFARGPAGGWIASRELLPAGVRGLRGVTLSAAADGTAVVAFERYDSRSVVMAAIRTPRAPWRTAVVVGPPRGAYEYGLDPDAGAGTRGRAVVVWSDRGGPIVAAARSARGRWTAPVRLADHGYGPKVALAPDGRGLAAWGATGPGRTGQRVAVRARAGGGSWGPARIVPGPRGTSAGDPSLAVGAGGRALLAVGRGEGSTLPVHVATRARSGAFAPLRRLPQPMVFPAPVVPAAAVDAVTAIAGVAWLAGDRVRLVTRRRPGGAWSAVRSLGPTSRAPSLAAAGGRLLVGWVESGDRIVVREVRP